MPINFFFQIEFIYGANNKKYKKGIKVLPHSFVRIDAMEALEYIDPQSSTGTFHWLLTGEFSISLHEYDDFWPVPENPEAFPIENAYFEIGLKNICVG